MIPVLTAKAFTPVQRYFGSPFSMMWSGCPESGEGHSPGNSGPISEPSAVIHCAGKDFHGCNTLPTSVSPYSSSYPGPGQAGTGNHFAGFSPAGPFYSCSAGALCLPDIGGRGQKAAAALVYIQLHGADLYLETVADSFPVS